MKARWSIVTAALAAIGLSAVTMAPAYAAPADTGDSAAEVVEARIGLLSAGETETVELTEEATMTLELNEPEVVTVADIRADRSLSATQRAEMVEAAAAATIWSNHWSQFTTGVAYTQTQNGTFYYNGSRVWVTQSYSGDQGSHACFTNYVITGWQITNITKSDSGSTTSRNLYCHWNVIQPMWITTSWSMRAYVYPNGTISGFGATVG